MAKFFTPKVNASNYRAVKQLLKEKQTYKQIVAKTGLGLTTIQAINQTDSLGHYKERLSSRDKLRKLQRRLDGEIIINKQTERLVRSQEQTKREGIVSALQSEQDDNITLAKVALWGWGLAVLFLVVAIVIFIVK